jgi:hypothetical protein
MIDEPEEVKRVRKDYSLSVIRQALINIGLDLDAMHYSLEDILNQVHKDRKIGQWRKVPVTWGGLEFESKRALADHLRISEQSVFYYLKNGKEIQGYKIERL